MANIVWVPAKIRDDRLVPVKGAEPVDVPMTEALQLLGVDRRSPIHREQIRRLVPRTFVGTVRSEVPAHEGKVVPFFFRNDVTPGDIGPLLKRSPTFADRVVSVFMVQTVRWDSTVDEAFDVSSSPQRGADRKAAASSSAS